MLVLTTIYSLVRSNSIASTRTGDAGTDYDCGTERCARRRKDLSEVKMYPCLPCPQIHPSFSAMPLAPNI